MSDRLKRTAAFLAVLLVAIVGTSWHDSEVSHKAAETGYENSINSCESGNVVRFVLHDIAEATIEARTEAAAAGVGAERATDRKDAARYSRDKNLLQHVPGGEPDGTRDCKGTIEKP